VAQAAVTSIRVCSEIVKFMVLERRFVVLNILMSFENVGIVNRWKNEFCHGKDQAFDLSRPALLFCGVDNFAL